MYESHAFILFLLLYSIFVYSHCNTILFYLLQVYNICEYLQGTISLLTCPSKNFLQTSGKTAAYRELEPTVFHLPTESTPTHRAIHLERTEA